MGALLAEARAAWAIARNELRIALRYRLNTANRVLQSIYQTLIPGILLGATFAIGGEALGLEATAGTTDLVGFLIVGMLVLKFSAAGFWDVAHSMKNEMDSGTLEPAWLTPTLRETLVLGRTLAGLALAVVSSVVLLGIGAFAFGANLVPHLGMAVPILALTTVGVLGIAYLVSAMVLRMKDANFFVDAANYIVFAVSGAAFPIIVLPGFVQWLGYLLPTTYAVDLLRVSALGTRPLLDPALEWLLLGLTSVLMVLVGRRAWLRTERRMRVRGTLGQH